MQPLQGIRVLDCSRILAGPFCAMNLADLGADVIKIESVQGGDETRYWGPPFIGGESAYYLCANRNKRSLAIDLKHPEGQKILNTLLQHTDVLLHNFLPASAQHLGLTYEQVSAVKPDLIYCSISGFGRQSDEPGYDYLMQAMGGLMSITGYAEAGPVKVGVAITDVCTGLYATIAIQAALRVREQTGQGQAIDMALYDTQLAMLVNVASNVLTSGIDAKRIGNGHPNIVPYQLFHTRDGDVVITVGNDRQFNDFCHVLHLDELPTDPRFSTNAERVKHREDLLKLLETAMAQHSQEEVLSMMRAARVPAGPVQSVKESLASSLTTERQMIWESESHPTIDRLRLLGSPLKLEKTPPVFRLPPPRLGEHSEIILKECGFLENQIQTWIHEGVVATC
ncbi:CaiB/BaiF CoA transferase family protein [Alicyclobacillus tolerans]|uniref:Crotonobetainyl-CoA:carnitine CoA-transferase CaiB-like acyl-CoA transferase n=1 Tax=Alicyclobacillus tolerans TaxID=90970 RepID=A0ABT9LXZ6_9BACL|nr:CoA transferase [Alicyclobacillus tengchongensis]MDP9729144.1 crotonobetainyl-CoA:carnitine CoA-transferase CaiB-like acyl-CoA transferase [Alicyclobacillus tengchongensis]